jgi:hypothetical protein
MKSNIYIYIYINFEFSNNLVKKIIISSFNLNLNRLNLKNIMKNVKI